MGGSLREETFGQKRESKDLSLRVDISTWPTGQPQPPASQRGARGRTPVLLGQGDLSKLLRQVTEGRKERFMAAYQEMACNQITLGATRVSGQSELGQGMVHAAPQQHPAGPGAPFLGPLVLCGST